MQPISMVYSSSSLHSIVLAESQKTKEIPYPLIAFLKAHAHREAARLDLTCRFFKGKIFNDHLDQLRESCFDVFKRILTYHLKVLPSLFVLNQQYRQIVLNDSQLRLGIPSVFANIYQQVIQAFNCSSSSPSSQAWLEFVKMQARINFRKTYESVKKMNDFLDSSSKDKALIEIAKIQAETNIEAALQIVRQDIKEDNQINLGLAAIAIAQAPKDWQAALDIAETITDPSFQVVANGKIAQAQVLSAIRSTQSQTEQNQAAEDAIGLLKSAPPHLQAVQLIKIVELAASANIQIAWHIVSLIKNEDVKEHALVAILSKEVKRDLEAARAIVAKLKIEEYQIRANDKILEEEKRQVLQSLLSEVDKIEDEKGKIQSLLERAKALMLSHSTEKMVEKSLGIQSGLSLQLDACIDIVKRLAKIDVESALNLAERLLRKVGRIDALLEIINSSDKIDQKHLDRISGLAITSITVQNLAHWAPFWDSFPNVICKIIQLHIRYHSWDFQRIIADIPNHQKIACLCKILILLEESKSH